MKKAVKRISISVVLLAVLVILAGGIVITQEDQYTLIRQFGKVDHVQTTAGISLKIPFIQTADNLPKKILIYDLPESDVITMDKKTMITDSYVLWKITDPLKFAQTLNGSVTNAERRIDTLVYNAIKNVISSMDQNQVISGRDGELAEAIMNHIGTGMDQYGLQIFSVETKRLDLPADNKEAVYERMISERDKIAATYTAEGQAEARVIQNTTDREITISISDAQAKAAEITAEGEAEYMRILAQAYSDTGKTEFYAFTRALESAKASLTGNNNTLILPGNSPISQIFMGN